MIHTYPAVHSPPNNQHPFPMDAVNKDLGLKPYRNRVFLKIDEQQTLTIRNVNWNFMQQIELVWVRNIMDEKTKTQKPHSLAAQEVPDGIKVAIIGLSSLGREVRFVLKCRLFEKPQTLN
jgi:hypothetical protein